MTETMTPTLDEVKLAYHVSWGAGTAAFWRRFPSLAKEEAQAIMREHVEAYSVAQVSR